METDKEKTLRLQMVFISLVAAVFAAGFLILAIMRFREFKKDVSSVSLQSVAALPTPTDSYNFQASADTIPASNLEWLANEVVAPKTVLKRMIHTTAVGGEITEIKRQSGKLPGLKDYYTGPEKGYYTYGGFVRLKPLGEGKVESFYFSPKRMEVMETTDSTGQKIAFDDLSIGSIVEIEETVDLAVSNINDQNVISLTIKIIK